MRFLRGVDRANVAAISVYVMMAAAGIAGCGGGSSTSPAPTVSVALTPATATVQANQGASFTATVLNDPKNDGTTWTLSGPGCMGAACGSLSGMKAASGAAVMYTAPAAVPNPPTVTLKATSVDDPSKSAKATITLAAAPAPPSPPSVSVTPGTANLATGGVTQIFTANVSNDSQNLGVTWSVSGTNCMDAACGSISPTTSASAAAVTYTSAARATSAGTVTVTAAAVAEASSTGAAAVTLAAPAAPVTNQSQSFSPIDVANGFGVPAIATDAAGNIDLAWINPDGVHFVRSTDAGATFSNPVPIPSDLSENSQNNLLRLIVDPIGNINLFWFRVLDSSATTVGYELSRSTDNGKTFTAPAEVTQLPSSVSEAQIAVRPDGKVIVTWIDAASNIQATSSSDGVTFSAPTTIALAVPGASGEQLGVGPAGQVYLAWTTAPAPANCSISFSVSTDAAVYSAPRTISGGAGACNSQSSMSVDAKGNLDVTWIGDTDSMFFARSVDDGTSFSTPIHIATPANPAGDEVVAGPDGGVYVIWSSASGTMFANSQDGGASFALNPTPLGVTLAGGQPWFTVDACGNVTVIGEAGHVETFYQRSSDGGSTFAAPVNISPFQQDFEQELAIDKSGNVNFAWAVDGPPQVDFARLPTVCHVQ